MFKCLPNLIIFVLTNLSCINEQFDNFGKNKIKDLSNDPKNLRQDVFPNNFLKKVKWKSVWLNTETVSQSIITNINYIIFKYFQNKYFWQLESI